ncbi:hypothetical protein LB236_14285 [Staphylococcus aureus]|nr:hypothetical protein [Staphylococcus aureus]MCA0102512.1 hypothetical protein [Staphylococcus aureus]MCA0109310.1 hypothetical protein [Staphylococcus aureus]MCA0112064.1 hypothetical protein [Staphylococcus aureus]MCA0162198.1 hypothetical protein [Staphylococcus aureus]
MEYEEQKQLTLF